MRHAKTLIGLSALALASCSIVPNELGTIDGGAGSGGAGGTTGASGGGADAGSCGDGIVNAGEQCDWGAVGGNCTGPDGGCNADLPDHCRPNCVLPSCGDGVVDTGEACDVGSLNGTEHGCNATCTLVGVATRIAGNGDYIVTDAGTDGGLCMESCYVDGPGDQAQFQEVSGIAVVGSTLYVADTGNEVVRAVDLTPGNGYTVSTLAGNPSLLTTQDGTGTAAGLFLPQQPLSYQGSLLLGTAMNIRQITLPGGVVTTFAGPDTGNKASENSGPPVPFAEAFFNDVTGLAVDPATGIIYGTDQGGGYLREIDPTTGLVSNLAGGGIGATFEQPTSCVVVNGALFLTDSGDDYVKRASLDNGDGGSVITNVAGGGAGFTDSSAPGGAAFNRPLGICSDGTSIYIVDERNKAIRQMDPASYTVTTLIGGPDTGVFDNPYDCVWDPTAKALYVTDQSNPQASPDGLGDAIYKIQ